MLRKRLCNEERQFPLEMKEGYKVSCVKILMFAELLGGWYLYEIKHTSSTVKTIKNEVKSGCL